jgi:hypothetical protein
VPSQLEQRFHQKMLEIYQRAATECSYRPIRFLQMVTERGGLVAAKDLLHAPRPAEGLTILWEHGRLDLSVEALVCEEPWRSLFTPGEIAEAKKRLKDLGYDN